MLLHGNLDIRVCGETNNIDSDVTIVLVGLPGENRDNVEQLFSFLSDLSALDI